jgi:hypothetical protein
MILGTFARFTYFFRPFRRGAYRHAPSIEELALMRQEHTGWMRRAIRMYQSPWRRPPLDSVRFVKSNRE